MTADSDRLRLGGSSARLYQYAVLQLVPDVARGERLNCGVVLLSRPGAYLGMETASEPDLWSALAPGLDIAAVDAHLSGLASVARGDPGAGPVAVLGEAARFHWLTSPGSTVVQPGPVHTGLAAVSPVWPDVLRLVAAAVLRGR